MVYADRRVWMSWQQIRSELLRRQKNPEPVQTLVLGIPNWIDEVIRRYKLGFDTNQLCMTIGSRNSMYLEDPPCLRVVDTRIQDVE